MLWLYLLGLATFLTIALRRVRRRQKPLRDELYAKNVAIEHVHSGVAWVRKDNRIGSANLALTTLLHLTAGEILERDWRSIFALGERERVDDAYSQMLLAGKATINEAALGRHGETRCSVLMVAVHDHKMRFIGHHCIVEDRTRERRLEERIRQLTAEPREIHLVS
ncbi:MAG TPA: PAS domain-containing protein [Bryobacteraceae bacterium]|nr:PAS domain-containing protein [Bryobacteraceae bacterium]